MSIIFLLFAAGFGALGVALGAFGSHILRTRISPKQLDTFETGVRYHLFHTVALLILSIAYRPELEPIWLGASGWLFVTGIVLFSGSLYLLVISNRRWIGAIAPFGGLAFIAGWLCLAASALL